MASREQEARTKLLEQTNLRDVIEICAPPEHGGDELILVFADGSGVSVKADRLHLDVIDDFEGELAAIRIEVVP